MLSHGIRTQVHAFDGSKPRLVVTLVVLALIGLAALFAPPTATANGCDRGAFAGGTGSEADPFLIATRVQLISLSTQGGRCASYAFRQTADIDLTGHSWTPIGDLNNPFGGIYDGGGHRISGITVDTGGEYLGLFGRVSGATIRDLVLAAPRIVGASLGNLRGALVGNALLATVQRVDVEGGSVEGADSVGGLIGLALDSEVRGSRSSAAVTGQNEVGGLLGNGCAVCVTSFAGGGTPRIPGPASVGIFESSASGPVSGRSDVGGLVGYTSMDVQRSWASGAVTATGSSAGGLAGTAVLGPGPVSVPSSEGIVDSFATGAVTAESVVGGLIGFVVDGEVPVVRSYASGLVRGGNGTGGLVGVGTCVGDVGVRICSADLDATAATASFWDVETTAQATSFRDFGEGRTTAQMRTEATFSGAGWKIVGGWRAPSDQAVWGICEGVNGGYPYLLWQYDATTELCTTTPSVPRDLSVQAGLRRVTASWQSSASDGYTPITSYTMTATPVGSGRASAKTCTAGASATTCTIAGLRAGRYTVAVAATNAKGTGPVATAEVRVAAPLRVVQRACPTRWSPRTKRLTRCTTATVPAGGTVRQIGTARVGDTRVVVCRFGIRVRRAASVGLACRLNARGRALARDGALSVRLVTTFDPFDGADARRPTLVRFAALRPVTG